MVVFSIFQINNSHYLNVSKWNLIISSNYLYTSVGFHVCPSLRLIPPDTNEPIIFF